MSYERTAHEQLVDQLEARRQQCQRFHPFDVPCADCDLWRDAATLLRARRGGATPSPGPRNLAERLDVIFDGDVVAVDPAYLRSVVRQAAELLHWYAGEASPAHGAAPSEPTREQIEAVPAWFQVCVGSELDRLIELVRFAPGQRTGFLHSSTDANGLIWRWALKWFQPKLQAHGAAPPQEQDR